MFLTPVFLSRRSSALASHFFREDPLSLSLKFSLYLPLSLSLRAEASAALSRSLYLFLSCINFSSSRLFSRSSPDDHFKRPFTLAASLGSGRERESVCVCVFVRACMCQRARERERERKRERERETVGRRNYLDNVSSRHLFQRVRVSKKSFFFLSPTDSSYNERKVKKIIINQKKTSSLRASPKRTKTGL